MNHGEDKPCRAEGTVRLAAGSRGVVATGEGAGDGGCRGRALDVGGLAIRSARAAGIWRLWRIHREIARLRAALHAGEAASGRGAGEVAGDGSGSRKWRAELVGGAGADTRGRPGDGTRMVGRGSRQERSATRRTRGRKEIRRYARNARRSVVAAARAAIRG